MISLQCFGNILLCIDCGAESDADSWVRAIEQTISGHDITSKNGNQLLL